jgi:hypothetical protein
MTTLGRAKTRARKDLGDIIALVVLKDTERCYVSMQL